MNDLETLRNLVLAPYIIKATALIAVDRKVGGNQFRHCFSTLGILLDYKFYNNSILLKASLLHDFLEDLPEADTHTDQKISDYLDQTEKFVIPMARKVNKDMVLELIDLVAKRREIFRMIGNANEDGNISKM
jgi:GTP pyrophosphokinase